MISRRRSGRSAALHRAALLLLVAALTAGWRTGEGAPGTHTIVIRDLRYHPAQLAVRRADTVVWRNEDVLAHTATSRGAFDSGTIRKGESWRYVAREEGTFRYDCTLHPNMRAALVVR